MNKLSERMRKQIKNSNAKVAAGRVVESWANEVAQLETQLQDANRKLAALGHKPTRSLMQQEWDDYEAERDRDFRETISDAYNSGNP